jgi:hypothetical protein
LPRRARVPVRRVADAAVLRCEEPPRAKGVQDRRGRAITDTLGRCWTIATTRTAVGFLWRIYCHRMPADTSADSLELMHPGGVAHGWTDDDHDDESIRRLLEAIMGTKDATNGSGS